MAVERMGIRRWISHALKRVDREISDHAAHGFYGGGLASEGYSGGYRDALHDVLLLLNGVKPTRRDYYENAE
jgi:hypothetical protein